MFDANTKKLPDFSEELNRGAEKAFGKHAQVILDSLLSLREITIDVETFSQHVETRERLV